MTKNKLIEIPDHHDILWYYDEDIPWIEIFNPIVDTEKYKRKSLASLRKWLNTVPLENVHFRFNKDEKYTTTGEIINGIRLMIFFDSIDDYIAFKLVFSEKCYE